MIARFVKCVRSRRQHPSPFDFRFANAGPGSVPATLGAFLLDVGPIAAAFGIEGTINLVHYSAWQAKEMGRGE